MRTRPERSGAPSTSPDTRSGPAGSNWMQSLATHDIRTFQAAY